GDMVFVDELAVDSPKTKTMVERLGNLTDGLSTLIVFAAEDDNLLKSTRNIADVKTLRANYLNIRDLLGFRKIVISMDALEVIQGSLAAEDGMSPVIDMSGISDVAEEEE
ncbi:MAG: 50S ribosomal protein L4, partial [Candidatus Promineifilaceae bacterium]